MLMKLRLLLFIISAFVTAANAQLVVSENAVMTGANEPVIAVSTSGNLTNAAAYTFDDTKLYLTLSGNDQQINGEWTVFTLQLSGGNEKVLNGNMTVTNAFVFGEGKLVVNDGASLTYTGAVENATSAHSQSYVIGPMTQRGGGQKFYPIGTETRYAFIEFSDIREVSEDVTVEAFDGFGMTTSDPSLRILDGYWNIEITDPSKINSPVIVPITPDVLAAGEDAVVIQSDGGLATNLGSIPGSDQTQVRSASPVASTVVGVGATTEIDITIHELITPYGSPGVFDQLKIHNLPGFAYNKVTLLDRYGVPLKEWEDYSNDMPTDFFRTLSPGNYICIVEYGPSKGNVRKKSQMVTVLKSR